MSQQLSRDTVAELFMNLMQHMKCIEVRLDYAKAATSQKQKYAINKALIKAKGAINDICDLLGDSTMVLKVKKDLEKVDLVYVMLLTEQLFMLSNDDLEDVSGLIEKHINEKHAVQLTQ